jgi:hypothetical protein
VPAHWYRDQQIRQKSSLSKVRRLDDGRGWNCGQGYKWTSCEMVAEWVVQVYESIPEEFGQNTWKKQGYECV